MSLAPPATSGGMEVVRMTFSWNWVLIVVGALLILVEVAFGGFAGFDLVLIGSAFMIGGALGGWLGSPLIGTVLASVLCIAYILIGRRWVRRRMTARHTPSNVDAMLGRQALVIQRIAPHAPGQVKVNDEVWRAVVAPDANAAFETGALVTVAGVDGVTLQVR
jgi:membrane protein implicated in regulation of membrane protease activity